MQSHFSLPLFGGGVASPICLLPSVFKERWFNVNRTYRKPDIYIVTKTVPKYFTKVQHPVRSKTLKSVKPFTPPAVLRLF